MNRTFTISVTTSKEIPALADIIANRISTLDGVDGHKVEVKEVGVFSHRAPSSLPAPLQREAAIVGKALDAQSIEQGEVTL